MRHGLLKIILTVGLGFMLMASPVAAQQPAPVIEHLKIHLLPEYDRREMLVVYSLVLSPETSLPAQMTLRIPSQAVRPHALVRQDVDGLYRLVYNTTLDGPWLLVDFTTPSSEVQLEYYDPNLQREQEWRNFEYRWLGDYEVKSLVVEVLQPLNATRMTFLPDLGAGRQTADGMTYYTAMFGEFKPGSEFTLRAEYQKPDDSLSFKPLRVAAVEPISLDTAGRTTLRKIIPYLLGALGVLLVAGLLLWYWQSGREMVQRRRMRLPRSSAKQEDVYCHQCGKRARQGDLYCRTCGSRLILP